MRWIIATSLRLRYLVIGFAAILMYFGAQTLGHQKIDVFPEFAPVSVEIQTACLGLSPSEVESLTTVPLEAALQGVPGVYDVRSDSEPQLSAIYLYFRSGTDVLRSSWSRNACRRRRRPCQPGVTRRRCTPSCPPPAGSCRSG